MKAAKNYLKLNKNKNELVTIPIKRLVEAFNFDIRRKKYILYLHIVHILY